MSEAEGRHEGLLWDPTGISPDRYEEVESRHDPLWGETPEEDRRAFALEALLKGSQPPLVIPQELRFVTKDSGARQEFASGMVRDTEEGKARFDLVYWPMVERWAALMARGAEKYGDDNWRKADSVGEARRFRSSLLRHLYQYLCGDTQEDHGAAVFFNLSALEFLKEVRHVDLPPLR